MAVVIRLQGLQITAGSEDIRKFFTGLKIPDGGVHIIGGDREEAFIIFASDEDARRAMTRSGGCIQGSPVTLLLSSKTEMQTVLERSTKNVELDQKRRLEENTRCARRSVDPEFGRRLGSRTGNTPPPRHQSASNTDDVYVFLRGMPFSVTEVQVQDFFSGLIIDEIVLLKNGSGLKNGNGFVKFATREDAFEALKRDRRYIGSRYVEVSTTTADDWRRAAGKMSMSFNMEKDFERERSPVRNQRNPQHHARSQSPSQTYIAPDDEFCVLLENLSYTAEKQDIKTLFHNAKLEDDQILHLIGSDGKRTRSTFVLFRSLRDYCEALAQEKRLFLNRLIYTRPISREKMIALLESPNTADRPGNSERFQERPGNSERFQERPGNFEKFQERPGNSERFQERSGNFERFQERPGNFERFQERPGNSERFQERPGNSERFQERPGNSEKFQERPGNSERFQERPPSYPSDAYDTEKMCLFVRNLPFDVRKVEIMDFFLGFNIAEDKVFVLHDHKGAGVGKALIVFQSEAEAMGALSLDGRRFLGSELILKCISRSQMRQLGVEPPMVQKPLQREEQYSGRSSATYRRGLTERSDLPMANTQAQFHRGLDNEPYGGGPQDRGNGVRGNFGPPVQDFDGPTRVQLANLPFQIRNEEIYDFCYGYRIVPGSVSLQYDQSGKPQGSATALFQSRQEALTAIKELSGRPIGPRKIQLLLG